MSHKNYFQVTGVIFLVIVVMHAFRIFYGWEAEIGGWMVPMWASWIGIVVAGSLSFQAWKLSK